MFGGKILKKRLFFYLLLGFSFLFLAACSGHNEQTAASSSSTNDTTKNSTSSTESIAKTNIPTIFFHGYNGTANSFNSMISRIETDGYAEKELVLTVAVDGSITSEGTFTNSDNNPVIQVLFADNKNNEWNQAEWVKNVLRYLQENYQINVVNIVGHSMGGVSALRYLTAYGYDSNLPQISKFVGMGAPFNEFVDSTATQTLDDVLSNGPAEQNQRYLDYAAGITNIPDTIQFMLLAGQMSTEDLSDETVPLTSALAVYHLLQTNGNSVDYQVFMGVQHSQLHESPEVDQVVENYLWQ